MADATRFCNFQKHDRWTALSPLLALLVILVSVVLPSGTADAATRTSCPTGGPYCVHTFSFGGGSGHVVYITVDFAGTATFPVSWALFNPNGSENCYASFTFNAPATTWTCRLYSSGTYQVRAGTSNASGYIATSVS